MQLCDCAASRAACRFVVASGTCMCCRTAGTSRSSPTSSPQQIGSQQSWRQVPQLQLVSFECLAASVCSYRERLAAIRVVWGVESGLPLSRAACRYPCSVRCRERLAAVRVGLGIRGGWGSGLPARIIYDSLKLKRPRSRCSAGSRAEI